MLGMRGVLMLGMKGTPILDTKGAPILVLKNTVLLDRCREQRRGQKWLWYRIGRIVGRRNKGRSNESCGKPSKDMLNKITID